MNSAFKIVTLVFLVGLLVCIRMFEDSLFYDPLLTFYKSNFSPNELPQFDTFKLLGNLIFRFLLNTLISLAILWVIFRDRSIVKLSAVLYGLLFLILFMAFLVFVFSSESSQHMTLFYIRRFLIQPIFLLILLPAFYFQKKK